MKYKDLEVECEICGCPMEIAYPIPLIGEYHEDMYISQEMEYQERKRLEKIIKDTLEYIPILRQLIQRNEVALTSLKVLEDKLKGGNNE